MPVTLVLILLYLLVRAAAVSRCAPPPLHVPAGSRTVFLKYSPPGFPRVGVILLTGVAIVRIRQLDEMEIAHMKMSSRIGGLVIAAAVAGLAGCQKSEAP